MCRMYAYDAKVNVKLFSYKPGKLLRDPGG
jgi:hypothetical protein